ncbi:hypothetical protein PVK06_034122 [Gossypium arboreum]|uniref:Uncharacterized protein n=1 Tax=Gossypium arboreum TaxID=29729 RepID=A0ABR0NDA3_GOSAR|nr:hypothetical protein PVK06_034122 [Gossypium arboreum]
MTVYPLSGGGDAPLQEHRTSLPPNIVEPSYISLMPNVDAKIEMSSMMSASSSLPTPSVKVKPTTNAEIKKPSMSSALFLRLGSDI